MQLDEALARNEAQLRAATPGVPASWGPAAPSRQSAGPCRSCGAPMWPMPANPLCTAFDELLDETIGGRP